MSDPFVASAQSPTESVAAPSFLVGCDAQGHWLAVETHGLGGGLFRDRDAALHYAAAETGCRRGAVRLSQAVLTLALDGARPPAPQGCSGARRR